MKYFALSFLFVLLIGELKSQEKVQFKEPMQLAKEIFAIFEKNDSLEIIKLKPTVDKFKRIIPAETSLLTDEEIYQRYVRDIKMLEDYNRIVESCKAGKMDWKKFRILDVETKEKFGKGRPVAFNIVYQYEDKEVDRIYCNAQFFEGEWFLISFQHSWDVFEKLRN